MDRFWILAEVYPDTPEARPMILENSLTSRVDADRVAIELAMQGKTVVVLESVSLRRAICTSGIPERVEADHIRKCVVPSISQWCNQQTGVVTIHYSPNDKTLWPLHTVQMDRAQAQIIANELARQGVVVAMDSKPQT